MQSFECEVARRGCSGPHPFVRSPQLRVWIFDVTWCGRVLPPSLSLSLSLSLSPSLSLSTPAAAAVALLLLPTYMSKLGNRA